MFRIRSPRPQRHLADAGVGGPPIMM